MLVLKEVNLGFLKDVLWLEHFISLQCEISEVLVCPECVCVCVCVCWCVCVGVCVRGEAGGGEQRVLVPEEI